ncbi:recombinase family protein [Anaerocolumna sp. MB42-C2]|uniref:recombinase family protein n=1 Tax=Anaerocolumna sp. MB42-C2 TaxID=3070997 RepID=UPI0027E1C5E4|nr:recombinase family protein [Anaerocolumna sp. MB42-C2]WMJ90473.1 recombinase family protein [Anaerocolumna sp. MB42-C2]
MKVAAYCRVSTESEDQLNSLDNQKKYFNDYINRNTNWEFTEIYVDEGITGTSIKKRYAFLHMLKDAQNHVFDLILTKEISRFARNTLDSIYYTRRLKDLGIGIIFLNDNINTLDPDAELRLTILASIAQEESRKTSERVKWGQKRSMERGVVFGTDLLGYDLRNGKLFINEREAETVRLIFHKFVRERKGTHVIARELSEAGIPTAGGKNKWYGAGILKILKNEKYCGDLIQKKTYTPDYLKHEKKYNHGEEEFITLYNHHEPIIERELFKEAQSELKQRILLPEEKKKYTNRYCFSGLIHCKSCGHSYVSRSKKLKSQGIYRYWRCYKAVQQGKQHTDSKGNTRGCDNNTVTEEDLKYILKDIIQKLKLDKEELINGVYKSIKNTIYEDYESSESKRKKLQKNILKKQHLIDMFLSNEITDTDYNVLKQKYDTTINQLSRELEEHMQKEKVTNQNTSEDIKEKIYDEIRQILSPLINGLEWNDIFYHNILDKINIYRKEDIDNSDVTYVEVYLKGIKNGFTYQIY